MTTCSQCWKPFDDAELFDIAADGALVPYIQALREAEHLPIVDPPIDPKDPRDWAVGWSPTPICRQCAKDNFND